VNVNAVGFGLIDTRLTKPMTDPDTAIEVGDKTIQVGMQESTREQVLKTIPLGRFGTTQDAANAVFFFCSPLSDYVTGEVLVCGGGVHF
jgi:3-oxoacyl-[acyl-carrier protein] reductase